MAKFEVWKKEDVGQRNTLPTREHYTLDYAMDSAKELSKETTKTSIYVPSKTDPWGGTNEDMEINSIFIVVERGNRQSTIRGIGSGGKWFDHRDCKRCGNSGNDKNVWGLPCASCNGASWTPKV